MNRRKMIQVWISRNDSLDPDHQDWIIFSDKELVFNKDTGWWRIRSGVGIFFITCQRFVDHWDINFALIKKGGQDKIWVYEDEVPFWL